MAQVMQVDKGFVATKGIEKQGHRFRSSMKPIKTLVVQTSNNTPRKMNFDFEIEQAPQTEAYDFLPSPPRHLAMDMVDWANSQPVALQSLYLEAKKRPEKRTIKPETTWPNYEDSTSNSATSGSFKHTAAQSRPLRRTNSSQRARLGPDSASTSKPPPAPVDPLWIDRLAVLAACQNVSERMDENTLLHAAKIREGDLPKRKAKASHIIGVSKTRRASMPISVVQQQELGRWEKGKQRENFVSEARMRGMERSSLLASTFFASSSTSAPSPAISSGSSYSIDTSLTTDLDSTDTSMMDVDPEDKHDSSQSFADKTKTESARSRETTSSTVFAGGQLNPTALAPKLHPLLIHKHPHRPDPIIAPPIPRHHPHPAPAPLPERPPPAPQNPPTLSQSTRPPALGMRRGHSMPIPIQHSLPTRQKGFKPPLLSQPLPQSAALKAQPLQNQKREASCFAVESTPVPYPHAHPKASVRSSTPQAEEQLKAKPGTGGHHSSRSFHQAVVEPKEELRPRRSPSPVVDPDSSFGDMSFDMDALEATMQMYD